MTNCLAFPNGLSLHLDIKDGQFAGIREVAYEGIPLRSPALPWTFYTESETFGSGVRFERFAVDSVSREGDDWIISLSSEGQWMPRAQSADAMGEARIKARRLAAPRAHFRWRFRPIVETIESLPWPGLAMTLETATPDFPIHWLLEVTTWEIAGHAEGCTLIQQDVSSMDLEQEVTVDSAFSTMEKFFTEAKNAWGGSYPMDMLPRAAGAAIMDFQWKDDVALCLFSERPGLTRARLEKAAGEDVVHYLDRYFFPLTESGSTRERKLLVHRAAAPLERHEARNLWLDCFTTIRQRILDAYGFQLEHPLPCVTAHLWDKDLKTRGDRWTMDLERDLPEYSRLGFQELFTHGVWDSVTSDPAPRFEGNICSPYAFHFAPGFGGDVGMRRLFNRADEHGIRVMQWFSFHLSQGAPVWKTHPDWVLREANGDPWDANYGILWSGRIRSEYGAWFESQILRIQERTGINGIFWDSYQNLGVTCLDWGAPDKAPQAEEIFQMQAKLQRAGFRQRVEVVTIFGVSQVAIFGFRNDHFRRRLWDTFEEGDHAFALLDCSPAFFSRTDPVGPEKLNPRRYFWLAAHRAIPPISADPWGVSPEKCTRWPGGEFAEEFGRINRLYTKCLPSMARLRLQPNGTHVVWLDEKGVPALVWAFKDLDFPFPGEIRDVEADEPHTLPYLVSQRVYALQTEAADRDTADEELAETFL